MIKVKKQVGWIIAFVVIFSTVPLFASGKQEAPKAKKSVTTGFNWQAFEGTRLKIMVNKHPWVDIIKPKLAKFEALTGMKVDLAIYPEDQFRTKRTVEMVSGTSDVDVFMLMPGNALAQYVKSGWLAPLNDFMNSKQYLWPEYDLKDIYPAALNAGVRNGKNYTIPLLLETSLLAYNKEIFKKVGVTVPKTMNDLELTAKKIYDSSNGNTYGITLRGKKAAATSQWVDFLHSFGGEWLDSNGKAAVGSPQSIAATKFYGKLLRLYGPKSAPSNSWYESISIFMQGKAAMIYDASVFKPDYENPQKSAVAGKVGYAIIPKGPAGSIPHVSNWGLTIYSGSRHKAAGWLFIQWATSKEIALEGQLAGIPSARASAWESEEFKSKDTSPEWTKASIASYKVASPLWNPPVIPVGECRDAMGAAIVASILGQDVEKACKEAAKAIDKILASSN